MSANVPTIQGRRPETAATKRLSLYSKDLSCPGQGNSTNNGRLERKSGHVLRFEIVNVRLAASACQHLNLQGHHSQKTGYALGGLFDVQPLHQFGILSGNAHRAASGVAMVAVAGFGTEPVVVGNI